MPNVKLLKITQKYLVGINKVSIFALAFEEGAWLQRR